MRKLLLIILNTILCTFFAAVVIINLINILELENLSFTLDFSLLNRKEAYKYIVYLIGIAACLITALGMLSTSDKKKADRDKKNFSHLSTVYEAKRGLTRVQYENKKGNWEYNEHTKLALIDILTDMPKKEINNVLTFFRVEDRKKLNTRKSWEIDGIEKTMRAGIPIYMPRFRKKTMFLDVNDVHNLLIGTTNSGKSMSLILQMIEMIRMAGECGVINDPKGELYEYTAQQFKDDGYEVIRLNFVNPEASDDWGILQYVWDEYKKAYELYKKEIEEWKEEGKDLSSSEKAAWLSRKPEPDYSIAIEYLTDIASILTYEKNANDSAFWNDSAKDLIVGEAAFLMEECIKNENVTEDMLNFKSIKLGIDIGDEPLSKTEASVLNVSAKTIMEALLKLGREVDDTSSINLNAYCNSADQTKRSIKSVFNSKISLLTMNEQIMRMTSRSSFDIKQLGHKKMVIYLIVHDEKETYYPLVTLFIKQLYESVINEARGNKGRLPIPVNVIIDEAGNCPPFKNIAPMLTAGRSRGVRFTLAVQDTSQLVEKYGKDIANTIQNNCTNTVYLLGSQPETLKRFSEMCGNKQVWIPSRQVHESRPLISVDRLQHMNLGEVVVHRQRKAPFITRMIPYDKCKFYKGKIANPNEKKPKKKNVSWLNPKMILNEYGNIFQ